MSTEALKLAIKFHDTYERLAPAFGYETRADTKAFNPDSANGKLMQAVCAELLPAAAPAGGAEPVAPPEGWKLVPVEATPQMLDAAAGASMQHLLDCIADPKKARDIGSEENVRLTHASRYRKMIAAAPTAQPQPERYVSALDPALRAIKAQPEAPAEPSGTRALLGRWVVFGKAMWKAGSSLPRHLVHDTEALLATPAPAAPAEPSALGIHLNPGLQGALNALRMEVRPALVNDVEHHVRESFAALWQTTETVRRMYRAAQDRCDAFDAAQPDPFATPAPVAAAEPSDKPLGYVKFRAAQTLQTDGYCDGHEWLEFCEPGELGDDKKPAFAVYASPEAAPAAQQPAELSSLASAILSIPCDTKPNPLPLSRGYQMGWRRALVEAAKLTAPSTVAQQQAELTDAARLDFLQARGATIEILPRLHAAGRFRFRIGGLHAAADPDIRVAIDAAIKAQGGSQ